MALPFDKPPEYQESPPGENLRRLISNTTQRAEEVKGGDNSAELPILWTARIRELQATVAAQNKVIKAQDEVIKAQYEVIEGSKNNPKKPLETDEGCVETVSGLCEDGREKRTCKSRIGKLFGMKQTREDKQAPRDAKIL